MPCDEIFGHGARISGAAPPTSTRLAPAVDVSGIVGMLERGNTAAIGGADGVVGAAADAVGVLGTAADGVVGAADENDDDETVSGAVEDAGAAGDAETTATADDDATTGDDRAAPSDFVTIAADEVVCAAWRAARSVSSIDASTPATTTNDKTGARRKPKGVRTDAGSGARQFRQKPDSGRATYPHAAEGTEDHFASAFAATPRGQCSRRASRAQTLLGEP